MDTENKNERSKKSVKGKSVPAREPKLVNASGEENIREQLHRMVPKIQQ